MVKSKSEGIKEYQILLETCVQVFLSAATKYTESLSFFGVTAQGTHQPGCPRAGIAPCSFVAFPFSSSHPLLHLPGSSSSWNLLKIVLWFWLMRESTWELQIWCRKSRRAQPGASTGSKEQPQSWHSWAPLNCSTLMAWGDCCRNRLQTTRGWPQPCRAQDRLAEGQRRTTECLHSLVFGRQGPSGYRWAIFKLTYGISELLAWW